MSNDSSCQLGAILLQKPEITYLQSRGCWTPQCLAVFLIQAQQETVAARCRQACFFLLLAVDQPYRKDINYHVFAQLQPQKVLADAGAKARMKASLERRDFPSMVPIEPQPPAK